MKKKLVLLGGVQLASGATVEAGPPLNENLRRALRGDTLQRYVPQARSLYLISAGNKYAIGPWEKLAWQGGWVWWWKDVMDRAFVGRYSSRVS